MLVLSRRRTERIIMGSGDQRVDVVVIDLRSDKVRLGIDAPRDYPVHRSEIYAAIEKQSESTDRRELHIRSPLPEVVHARDSHLLLRFPTTDAMTAALMLGRVSFFPTDLQSNEVPSC